MPLTNEEFDFLDAYAHETTNPPFGGPAKDSVYSFGLVQSDIGWLLAAYNDEAIKRGRYSLGTFNPQPHCPWSSKKEAQARECEMAEELRQRRARSVVEPIPQ